MKQLQILTIMAYISLVKFVSSESLHNEFKVVNGCSCPGYNITFECTVLGEITGATIWTGTAFDCESSSDEILLRHSPGGSPGFELVPQCNNGDIVAKQLNRSSDGVFTSQLNITFNTNLVGKTIECIYALGATERIIETHTIKAYNSPPDRLHINLADFNTRKVNFVWSPVTNACSSVTYETNTSNCGSCPTTTNHTNATCVDVPTDGSTCVFAIKPIICNITGNRSDAVKVNMLVKAERTDQPYIYVVIVCVILPLLAILLLGICLLLRNRTSVCKSNSRQINTIQENNIDIYSVANHGYGETCIRKSSNEDVYNRLSKSYQKKSERYTYRDLTEPVTVESVLLHLPAEVVLQWHIFGLAIGISTKILQQLKNCSEKDALTKILKYWLQNHHDEATWKEIADAQAKVEFFQLASQNRCSSQQTPSKAVETQMQFHFDHEPQDIMYDVAYPT